MFAKMISSFTFYRLLSHTTCMPCLLSLFSFFYPLATSKTRIGYVYMYNMAIMLMRGKIEIQTNPIAPTFSHCLKCLLFSPYAMCCHIALHWKKLQGTLTHPWLISVSFLIRTSGKDWFSQSRWLDYPIHKSWSFPHGQMSRLLKWSETGMSAGNR